MNIAIYTKKQLCLTSSTTTNEQEKSWKVHLPPALSLSLTFTPFWLFFLIIFIFFCFLFFCLFLFNKFSRNLPHCRYGRVQSVKIIISPGTITVPSSQPSPTGTITSTSELNASVATIGLQHPSGDHHLSSTHLSGINKCSLQHLQQPTAVPSTVVGSTHMLEPAIGVNSCSNVSNNSVTSSNHNCITMCAATIAFMDIKSASKAHLAEHKFDDRILTTEYYEPSAMHHGSAEGGSSLAINSKMSGDGAAVGDVKDTTTHGRFASTSSHGLVWKSITNFARVSTLSFSLNFDDDRQFDVDLSSSR